MGEVIHGDYSRWVNGQTLHSVTNYALHKALYSGHNDHNYFEIAHTVKYLQNMGDLDLYNFVDNHDVERIHTKLQNKAHFAPVHVLLYTLPGVPSIYYGSEFGIDGKKEKFSDASLRPALDLKDYADAVTKNPCKALIAALGKVRQGTPALSYGSYSELALTNRHISSWKPDLTAVCSNTDTDPSVLYPYFFTCKSANIFICASGWKIHLRLTVIIINGNDHAYPIQIPGKSKRERKQCA